MYKILIERSEENRPLEKHGCRLRDIEINMKEMGQEDVDCIHLSKIGTDETAVNTVMSHWSPYKLENLLTSLLTISFFRTVTLFM